MQPVPPARRTATLPNISTPVGAPAPTPTAAQLAAAQQHHRSLVAHYWNFAQQGFAAPLTAVEGSEERRRQEVARTEAVEWARQCGIFVVDPAAPPPPAAIAPGPVPTPAAPAFVPQSTPTALASTATAPVPSYGHPLPSAPLPPASAAPTPATASLAPATAVLPPQQSTQASSPSTAPAGPRPLPMPQTGPPRLPPNPQRGRPLPVPPSARSSTVPSPSSGTSSAGSRLEARLDQLHLSGEKDAAGEPERNDARASSPAVPTVVFSDGSEEPSDGPKALTFSFSVDGDEGDGQAASPTPSAIPSFSFACDDEQASGETDVPAVSAPSGYRPSVRSGPARPPPLHPRFDPSHPSHRLYHPTSVMSPLSPDGTAHPTAGGSVVQPDAGTIACSGCSQLIFGRVLFALGKSWHPDCFRCAEEGCGAKLEVMEFEGTPEEWEEEEDGEGEGEEGEKESLRGKAWCMVHFEEVSAFHFRICSDCMKRLSASRPPRLALRPRMPPLSHPDRFRRLHPHRRPGPPAREHLPTYLHALLPPPPFLLRGLRRPLHRPRAVRVPRRRG